MTKKDRNFSRVEEIEDTWQLDAMCDPGLDPGQKKAIVDNWGSYIMVGISGLR